eukprot:SAG31_NODE_348_length_17296_cov_5.089482_12_plen_163_part_00
MGPGSRWPWTHPYLTNLSSVCGVRAAVFLRSFLLIDRYSCHTGAPGRRLQGCLEHGWVPVVVRHQGCAGRRSSGRQWGAPNASPSLPPPPPPRPPPATPPPPFTSVPPTFTACRCRRCPCVGIVSSLRMLQLQASRWDNFYVEANRFLLESPGTDGELPSEC